MRNVHERSLPVPPADVAGLLDSLGSPADRLWPAPSWPPMVLDGPLRVGAAGGHDFVRYAVVGYTPGRCVEFRFAPEVALDGWHRLELLDAGGDACVLRHTLEGRPRGPMVLGWHVAVRWLHDCLLEQLLDNAERAVTGRVARPHRPSPWVRLLKRVPSRRPRLVGVPDEARLAREALTRVDFADAMRVHVPAGVTADPREWAQAVFHTVPAWVGALLRLRNALVGLVGVERGDRSAFDVLASTADEALLGADAGHLDFRASVLVEPGRATTAVTVTTVVTTHNLRGRLYMSVVRLVHPHVVRAMLARAARSLTRAPRPVHAAVTGDLARS